MDIETADTNVAAHPGATSIPFAPGEVVHHYTDSATALKILQARTLWLTAPWHLNDPREGADFMDFLVAHGSAAGLEPGVAEKACDLLAKHLFYVTCFSEEGDLLSQWRAYAKDAQGMSIGFDRAVLRRCLAGQSLLVERPVEYADTIGGLTPKGEADQVLQTLGHRHGIPSPPYLQTLSKVRYAVKRRAYREEREVRLIYTPDTHPAGPYRLPSNEATAVRHYFGTLSEIRDYYALTFTESIWPRLVRCITFGPKNRTNEHVARNMLDSLGLHSTAARYSEARYK